MSFPPRFLDDIRARVGLVDTISKRVKLTRKGREHTGLCPFHNEKSPSFTVNEEKGFYHCFGCGAHGDIISFVMNSEGTSFPETVERLAGDAGIEVPVESPEERERTQRRASLYDVVEAACQWHQDRLYDVAGREALAYLRGRGLDDATIKQFRLGFAPQGGGLEAAMRAQNIEIGPLLEAGLMRKPDDGRAPYPFFRDRVMFPISDKRDRVIAFGGRIMGDAKAAKYINSPDTPLFDKGRSLYNAAAASEAISKDGGDLVVAEGYMDVIALARAGMKAAVAPLGTAVTEDQFREMWRMTAEPVMCLDGDAAGQRAAARAATRALPELKPGKSLRFAVLPAGEDPDSLIAAEGPAAMRRVIESARPLSDLLWEMESGAKPVDTPERRADLESRLNARVREITDESVQGHYRTMFKDRLWAAFRPGRNKSGRNNPGRNNRGSGNRANGGGGAFRGQGRNTGPEAEGNSGGHVLARTAPLRGARRRQQALLAAMINQPGLRDDIDEALVGFEFDPDLDKLRQQLQNVFSTNWDLDLAAVKAHFEIGDVAGVFNGVLSDQVYQLAPFSRPGVSAEDARRGVEELLGRVVFERQQEELRNLGRSSTDEGRLFAAGQEAIENGRRLADMGDVEVG